MDHTISPRRVDRRRCAWKLVRAISSAEVEYRLAPVDCLVPRSGKPSGVLGMRKESIYHLGDGDRSGAYDVSLWAAEDGLDDWTRTLVWADLPRAARNCCRPFRSRGWWITFDR